MSDEDFELEKEMIMERQGKVECENCGSELLREDLMEGYGCGCEGEEVDEGES